jgi:hypothetical protein
VKTILSKLQRLLGAFLALERRTSLQPTEHVSRK